MSRFFIDRPIFAWVLAIGVMLGGIIAITTLPIAQYPQIAPPQVSIAGHYPGASARTVEDTVTQVIEQKMRGLDRLTEMASASDSSGALTITLSFENGTDPDIAQVQVQNKLALATPLLPQEVQQQGLQVSKSSTNFLEVVGFMSEDGSIGSSDIADYVAAHVQDAISRVDGVGDTQLFGSQHAMRIWLDPDRLNSFSLTPNDVRSAIQGQNAQVSGGQLGGLPSVQGQPLNATITAQTRLHTAEEFADILLRTRGDGSEVRLRDVARIELGAEDYGTVVHYNGKPATGLAIKLATGANALATVKRVDAALEQLKPFLPPSMRYVKPYDTTPFVRVSIVEVVKTLVEAVALVFLVMLLFLQNLRATLIPTIAVPVVLLGTFGVLALFGYTINTLTMFAMVLAIGLLVDDAIVVVENVERVMAEEKLGPREATRRSMDQITGALVGVALVLAAVFVPMGLFGGATGVIYRQFSVTIVTAMALSVLVALVLTPALCATLLEPAGAAGHAAPRFGRRFFERFNALFDASATRYHSQVGRILGSNRRYIAIYAAIVLVMGLAFWRLPAGFLPDEDQGVLFAQIQLPPGATQQQTLQVIGQVEQHFLQDQKEAVASIMTIVGFSFAGSGQNSGLAFISLKPWAERSRADLEVDAVVGKAMGRFSRIRDAMIFAFAPPAVIELGNASGFSLQLQDRAGLGHAALIGARNQLLGMAAQDQRLAGVRPNGQDDTPELHLEIDAQKAKAQGVSIDDINSTFSTAWGSNYVNDFLDGGRVKKVYLQADAPYRSVPEDIARWYVRNSAGAMVPFSSFATSSWTLGSPRLERYAGVSSLEIAGSAAPGTSSGEAMDAIAAIAAKLPAGIGFDWSGLSRQERASGSQAPLLYALSIVFVFLCLAALYESWSIPVSVVLVVPLGVIGAVLATTLASDSNDVYFKVGLLTTVGLASKNAILIVEFAKTLHEGGRSLVEAALEAARIRLRPILMTSLAFILGVLPLALSTGAGSAARHAIGWAVIGGMASGTLLAIFFVPLFYVLVGAFADRRKRRDNGARDAGHEPATQALPVPVSGASPAVVDGEPLT
jgi:multidrug efflux pump